jgi:malonate-semialdehyde dehydrogenase (acetylating)/methylmalonate-semialdehyde dehydrogenase
MAPRNGDGTTLLERADACHDASMSTTASETLLNHWIGGRRDEREAERHGEVSDPATGEIVARVPFATTGDVDRAVQAARKAAKEWGVASLT